MESRTKKSGENTAKKMNANPRQSSEDRDVKQGILTADVFFSLLLVTFPRVICVFDPFPSTKLR